MARKPGTIYELQPVTFKRLRPLPFAAVNCYLTAHKSVDVWIEGETIMMTAVDESAGDKGDRQPRMLRLAIRPGSGRNGDDMQVEVLP